METGADVVLNNDLNTIAQYIVHLDDHQIHHIAEVVRKGEKSTLQKLAEAQGKQAEPGQAIAVQGLPVSTLMKTPSGSVNSERQLTGRI